MVTTASPKAPKTETAGAGKRTPQPDYGSTGTTGLNQSGGFVHEEFLRELRGVKGALVFREMADNDDTAGAILFAFKTLLRGLPWSVQGVDETEEAEFHKEFVEDVLDDMETPFDSVIEEACSMFEHGFAPMELVYKRRVGPHEADKRHRSKYTDGLIGLRQISLRKQTTIVRWEFDDEDGSIKGCWQQPLSGVQVFIPIEKMALFRTTARLNNPEGRSILRNAYRSWYFKKRHEELEAIGVERDLAGMPVMKIPGNLLAPGADRQQKAAAAAWSKFIRNVRQDKNMGVLIPSDRDSKGNALYEFSLLSASGSRTYDTTKIIAAKNKAMATSVLADFIFLGQESVGSFALSSDKTAMFIEALTGFAVSIAAVFNRFIIPELWRLNALDYDYMPTLVPGKLEKMDLEKMGAFLTSLVGAGAMVFPDRELEEHLRKEAGLPPPPEEGEDMRAPPSPGTGDAADEPQQGAEEE